MNIFQQPPKIESSDRLLAPSHVTALVNVSVLFLVQLAPTVNMAESVKNALKSASQWGMGKT
jgi:hypothetical protein